VQEDIPGQEQPEPDKPIEAVKIFYCYDRKDNSYLLELEKRLKPLKSRLKITTWWDELMTAGTERDRELLKNLKESGIVLLLISSDFFASSECQWLQQQAMALYKIKQIFRIIPIRLRAVDFVPEDIAVLQPLPKDGESFSRRRQKDEAWVEVQRGIVEVVNDYFTQPQETSDARDGFLFIGLYPTNKFRWDTELRPAPGLVKQVDIPDSPWLVSEAVGITEPIQRYAFFREKTILRNFGTLSPTLDSIREFADRYGCLGNLVPLFYPSKVGQPESILWAGEAFQFWTWEIEEMKRLITIWDIVQNRQIEALRELIIWKSDPDRVLIVWRSADGTFRKGTVVASENISPTLFYQFKWGEVMKPALAYLINEIQQKLEGHINPRFYPAQQKMYMIPDSLLSALYILLLLEIQDNPIEPE
jgi:hypothetical protein